MRPSSSDIRCESLAVRAGGSALGGSGVELRVDDPSTAQVLSVFPGGGADDVDMVVTMAHEAAMPWRRTPPSDRAALCRSIAAQIERERARLVAIDVMDAGLPVSVAERDVSAAVRYFEFYAGLAESVGGRTLRTETGDLGLTVLDPWGVCGVILPFNLPVQLAARDLAPALAMGNAVVLKAPEQAPFAALALAEACWAAGAPNGLVGAVAGHGDAAGSALVEHQLVSHVTFTGSHETGARVMAAAARRLLPTTIELGGKSPHLVLADAPLERVAERVIGACMPTAGQACSAGTRVLAHIAVYEELRDRITSAMAALEVGPAAEDPDVGPLISAAQRETVRAAIDAARDEGARVSVSRQLGGEPPSRGHYVVPTLIETADHESAASQEEIFGPVLTMLPVDDEEDGIVAANCTPFGLVAGVWTNDLESGFRIAAEVDAGQVYLNDYAVGGGAGLPFGGTKRSGIGRLKGREGALEYTQVKTVVVPSSGRAGT